MPLDLVGELLHHYEVVLVVIFVLHNEATVHEALIQRLFKQPHLLVIPLSHAKVELPSVKINEDAHTTLGVETSLTASIQPGGRTPLDHPRLGHA